MNGKGKNSVEIWSRKANAYDDIFAGVTIQAIKPILAHMGSISGRRHLDIACGTGHLVSAVSQANGNSIGMDISGRMVEIAQMSYPACCFQVRDAADLPDCDNSVDVVTCSFGLHHISEPVKAIREVRRVLRPGGQFIFTQWFGAAGGNDYHRIVEEAFISCVGCFPGEESGLNGFRYADEDYYWNLLTGLGFEAVSFERLSLPWRLKSANEFLALIDNISSNTAALLRSYPEKLQMAIRDCIYQLVESRRENGVIELNWQALLTSARKSPPKRRLASLGLLV